MDKILRRCLRDPIPELFECARKLALAARMYSAGDMSGCTRLLRETDTPVLREWVDSLWGVKNPEIHRVIDAPYQPAMLKKELRPTPRMPDRQLQMRVIHRDGHHCRFCGIPVIQPEIRKLIHRKFPDAVPWGRNNSSQHSAFQCFWLQFDHVLPNGRGGETTFENLVITCAGCNFGRMERTCAEIGLFDPRQFDPPRLWEGHATWDGLRAFILS